MKLLFEKYWPIGITTVIMVFVGLFIDHKHLEKITVNTVDKAFTMSGVLLGFLLTIITIIGSIETRKMKFVKQTGNYKTLQKYLHCALYSSLALLVFSFTLSVFDQSYLSDYLKDIRSYILIGLSVFTVALSVRFSLIIIKLLSEE